MTKKSIHTLPTRKRLKHPQAKAAQDAIFEILSSNLHISSLGICAELTNRVNLNVSGWAHKQSIHWPLRSEGDGYIIPASAEDRTVCSAVEAARCTNPEDYYNRAHPHGAMRIAYLEYLATKLPELDKQLIKADFGRTPK